MADCETRCVRIGRDFSKSARRVTYHPAVATGVRVTEDECHVIPVSVSLDLRAAVPPS